MWCMYLSSSRPAIGSMDSSDFRNCGTLSRDLEASSRDDGGHGGSVLCGGIGVDAVRCAEMEVDLLDPVGFSLCQTVG